MTYYKKNIGRGANSIKRSRMRVGGYLLLLFTVLWLVLLSRPIAGLPAIGRLLEPMGGCWANAEPVNKSFENKLKFSNLSSDATVWFDNRLVPHIHAQNAHDIYFIQGYIHAYFRLWQMDMQTRAAAGRVSEVTGESAFDYDRKQRRKGMLYAAENSLKAAEKDSRTKKMLDAYTDGVNSYISSINYTDFPLEYKLMGFSPEPWTNIKSVLLLKFMADDLTGKTDDIAHSYLRSILTMEDFDFLYPDKIEGSTPVIPEGTAFDKPSLHRPIAPPDSVAFPRYTAGDFGDVRQTGKGSNNWAISPERTALGAAILCNDPHLALNLPSLWFETQMQTPDMNVYGASLPGAPGVVIGFNDSLSWGLTNNYRDVKDYYEIKPVKGTKEQYWFAGKKTKYSTREEKIVIKGQPTFTDTVRYTVHGPLMYDEGYNEKGNIRRPLAICWMGHRPSNEILAIYQLNRANNYDEFVNAILHFECPAQNMIYADRKGNIAIGGQGQFVNKWKNQGEFIMNGWDSATLWQDLIPMRENPHVLNPERGFLSSANQCVTDSTYPYWYNGDFAEFRGWRINQALSDMPKATMREMFALQNDAYSVLAGTTLPAMLSYCTALNSKYLDTLREWNCRLSPGSMAGSIYQLWWRNLYLDIWMDEFKKVPNDLRPQPERTMQLILMDKNLKYYDDKRTKKKESLKDIMIRSFKKTADSLDRQEKTIGLAWYLAKNTSATHLTRLPAFSYDHLYTGGWGNTVNAMKNNHGPSWRMVVQMGKEINAYGVYPGGQSGNPGSKYYASYLKHWVNGKYYKLLFLPNVNEQESDRIKYTWNVSSK